MQTINMLLKTRVKKIEEQNKDIERKMAETQSNGE